MDKPTLSLRFKSASALVADYERDLCHGRAAVTDKKGVGVGVVCHLILHHPESTLTFEIDAESVAAYEEDGKPTLGLLMQGLDGDALREFVHSQPAPTEESKDPLAALSVSEQVKLARTGTLEQRTQLERRFGKTVWEALLKNPKLTIPEVARIARKGTVPRMLLDLICDNSAWVRASVVRRALLQNTRLAPEQVQKVLRQTPKSELRQAVKNGAYPARVRDAARKQLASSS